MPDSGKITKSKFTSNSSLRRQTRHPLKGLSKTDELIKKDRIENAQ